MTNKLIAFTPQSVEMGRAREYNGVSTRLWWHRAKTTAGDQIHRLS